MYGKGKFKRGRSAYSGSGMYTGSRSYAGRGMYTGRGNYAKKVAKFAGKVSRFSSPAASIAAQTAAAYGNPQAALAIQSASKGIKMLGGKYSGRGNYVQNPQSNILLNGSNPTSTVPTFQSLGDETGALVITHSEYMSDVYGLDSGRDFQSTSYSMNPGLNRMFPYLSQIAANFEEYEFIQMVVTYKPKLNPNLTTTNGQLGSVMMFTDYNPDDEKKESKQHMIQGYGTTNGRVTDELLHFVECSPDKLKGDGHRFVRVRNPITASGRLMDYDHGLFQVAVSNTPSSLANESLGELYVSYTVKLLKPRIYTLYGLALDTDYYQCLPDGRYLGAVTNSLNCSWSNAGGITCTFPANVSGHFHLTLIVETQVDEGIQPITETPHKMPQLFGQVTQAWLLQYYNQLMRWNLTSSIYSKNAPDDFQHLVKIEAMVRVEQASNGIDNQIKFVIPPDSKQANVHNVSVRRINEFELGSRVITYKDDLTGDLIPTTKSVAGGGLGNEVP